MRTWAAAMSGANDIRSATMAHRVTCASNVAATVSTPPTLGLSNATLVARLSRSTVPANQAERRLTSHPPGDVLRRSLPLSPPPHPLFPRRSSSRSGPRAWCVSRPRIDAVYIANVFRCTLRPVCLGRQPVRRSAISSRAVARCAPPSAVDRQQHVLAGPGRSCAFSAGGAHAQHGRMDAG